MQPQESIYVKALWVIPLADWDWLEEMCLKHDETPDCQVRSRINGSDTYMLGITMGISAEFLLLKFVNFLKQILFNSLVIFFYYLTKN